LHGAFFYVTAADDARARELMRSRGYRPYDPDEAG
jgi:hypothetical protein